MIDRTHAYRETLAGLRDELAGVESRAEMIRSAINAITSLLGESSTAMALPQKPRVPDTTAAPLPVKNRDRRKETIGEAAEQVLKDEGRHLRARQIAELIVQRSYFETQLSLVDFRASVGGVIARKAGAGDTFTKPEPGLFGLIEWDGRGPQETQEDLLANPRQQSSNGE